MKGGLCPESIQHFWTSFWQLTYPSKFYSTVNITDCLPFLHSFMLNGIHTSFYCLLTLFIQHFSTCHITYCHHYPFKCMSACLCHHSLMKAPASYRNVGKQSSILASVNKSLVRLLFACLYYCCKRMYLYWWIKLSFSITFTQLLPTSLSLLQPMSSKARFSLSTAVWCHSPSPIYHCHLMTLQ